MPVVFGFYCPSDLSRRGPIINAPEIFISKSGTPAGIFIDIIEHIAKSEGWQLGYVADPG
jgi:hypothetical protein